MTTLGSKVWDMLHLIRHGGPALCNIAITNSCNATCDFCNNALAQVTMSNMSDDYRSLVPLLRDLGFEAVTSSYPQRIRLGSSSLAWSADSDLMNFTDPELEQAFEAVDDLRNVFRVNNPHASVADMKRHLRGEPEHFVCYGGYKSFYMDW